MNDTETTMKKLYNFLVKLLGRHRTNGIFKKVGELDVVKLEPKKSRFGNDYYDSY